MGERALKNRTSRSVYRARAIGGLHVRACERTCELADVCRRLGERDAFIPGVHTVAVNTRRRNRRRRRRRRSLLLGVLPAHRDRMAPVGRVAGRPGTHRQAYKRTQREPLPYPLSDFRFPVIYYNPPVTVTAPVRHFRTRFPSA